MRPGPPVLVLAACASLAPAACGGEVGGAPAVTRTDSAGIEIVQGPREDAPLAWRFERAFAVGGAVEGPEAFFGVSETDVAADAAGRIHVLDRGNQRVVVFDSTGRHLRTLGGEGRGPGQLGRPMGLAVEPDGTVRVFDLGRGLVGFGPRGDTLPVRRLGGVPFVQGMAATPAGLVVQLPAVEETPARTRLLRIAGADTTELSGGPLWQHAMVRFESCGLGLRLGPVFEPSFRWAAGAELVTVVTGAEYAIEVFEGAERTASVRRPLPAREATRALAAAELGEGMEVTVGGEPRTCETEEVLEKSGIAERIPVIARVAVAPDGTLWVERKVVGPGGGPEDGGGPIDVFGPDLAYEGTLPSGSPFPDAFAGPDRIVVHETDELDVSRFVAYDVVRGGEGEGR